MSDSPLAGLADARRRLLAAQQMRFQVPGWDAPGSGYHSVTLVLRPIEPATFAAATRRVKAAKGDVAQASASLEANAHVLSLACTVVEFAKADGDTVVIDMADQLERDALAESLGLLAGSPASAVISALFLKDLQVITAGGAYLEWCTDVTQRTDEESLGD